MPNHVTTICVVSGPAEIVDQFRAAHIVPGDDGGRIFELGTVIPKPACVAETESGSEADQGFFALTGLYKVGFAMFMDTPMHSAAKHLGFPMGPTTTPKDYAAWLAERNPRAIEKGRKALVCFRETGFLDWYDWSIANWGTKWGAYNFAERSREPGRYVFKFESAWSFPRPIFDALAERYPSLSFKVTSIDEGGPQYEGLYAGAERRYERADDDPKRYRMVYGRDRETDDEEELEEAST